MSANHIVNASLRLCTRRGLGPSRTSILPHPSSLTAMVSRNGRQVYLEHSPLYFAILWEVDEMPDEPEIFGEDT
jgi:hypothetical protein